MHQLINWTRSIILSIQRPSIAVKFLDRCLSKSISSYLCQKKKKKSSRERLLHSHRYYHYFCTMILILIMGSCILISELFKTRFVIRNDQIDNNAYGVFKLCFSSLWWVEIVKRLWHILKSSNVRSIYSSYTDEHVYVVQGTGRRVNGSYDKVPVSGFAVEIYEFAQSCISWLEIMYL